MEVSYERDEEEVMGMDLDTTRKSKKFQSLPHPTKNLLSPTSSSDSATSTITTASSSDNISFEHTLASMNTNGSDYVSNTFVTNGEKHKVLEVTNVIEEEEEAGQIVDGLAQVEEFGTFEESKKEENGTNVAEVQETNGFSVHQNGSSTIYSLRENGGEDRETVGGSNGHNFSKSPDTDVGFKDVESFLDTSSNGVSPTPPEILTATQNVMNGNLSGQNENDKIDMSTKAELKEEEFDVERVIQKQETHDLICPNCRSCITKRVILRRRKRKVPDPSTSEEASGSTLDQDGLPAVTDDIAGESEQPSLVDLTPDARVDGISCFSCFSFFIPSGEGFLCWRFKPKEEVAQQTDGTLTDAGQVSAVGTEDSKPDGTGNFFPLWVVTCCQPADRKTPGRVSTTDSVDDIAAMQGSNYQPALTDDNGAQPQQTYRPLPPSDGQIPLSSEPGTLLTPEHVTSGTVLPTYNLGTSSQNKPLKPIIPEDEISSSEIPPVTPDEGQNFPMWFLTCCQPSVTINKREPSLTSGGVTSSVEPPSASADVKPPSAPADQESPLAPSGGLKPRSKLSDGKIITRPEPPPSQNTTTPPSGPSDENPVSQRPEPPLVPAHEQPVQPKPAYPFGDSSSQIQPPMPPARGEVSVQIPEEPLKPQPVPTTPPHEYGSGPVQDIQTPLLESQNERPRPGVAGVDIIKAIVYGGLLESITSLSVITSAAGGDATTLNIVALGLANVFGGLVVLIHNLRLLNHEHSTSEHYEAQLGRPGHYLLHAIVAVISYLMFGLMSPIIYGFSFRLSDKKDYKLAVLAAASLVSITVLSTAKAYVRNPPKAYIQTIFYYVGLGFMVSGVGYVAGDLINMLLIKLGVFDSRSTPAVLGAGSANGAWSSY